MKNRFCLHRPAFSKQDRAFTLTEMAIVLGIVGIILGAIWVAMSGVNQKNTIDQATQELQTIAQNMLTLYQNRPLPGAPIAGCPGLPDITGNAISAGIIPSWAVTGACTAVQPWSSAGGSLIIHSEPGNIFRVSFYGVKLDACIGFLIQATGCDPTQVGCPSTVYTNGGANSQAAGAAAAGGWQVLTPALAKTLCSANPAGGSVEFDYKL